jgi:hypothetical protein
LFCFCGVCVSILPFSELLKCVRWSRQEIIITLIKSSALQRAKQTRDERGARSLYRIKQTKSQEPRDQKKKGIEGGELDGGSTAARCWLWLCFGSGCCITVAVQLDSYASSSSSHCGVHQS